MMKRWACLKAASRRAIVGAYLILAVAAASGQSVNINCGGANFTASDGTVWVGDTDFIGGDQLYTGYAIANVSVQDFQLYRSGRYGLYGDFSYNIPVPNGTYSVTLLFAEILYSGQGQRVFNVTINGNTVLSNFDILAHVPPLTPLQQQFTVPVTTGALQIGFVGVAGRGLVNGIRVAPSGAIGPSLSLGASTLTFSGTAGGSNPASQSVSVGNTGGGTLNWTISSNQPWLTVSPAAGTNAGSLTVGANLTGLAAGSYSGTVTVSAAGASSSPQTVGVTLTVAPATPVLVVGSGSLSFAGTAGGANPAGQPVSISNGGAGTLSWAALGNQPWLTVSPASGTNAGSLTVGANLTGLAAGSYSGTVTVSATGALSSPQTIGVTLTVAPATPVLVLGSGSLSFAGTAGGANPAGQPVSVSNGGGGTLSWTASGNQPWLSVSGGTGTGAGAFTVQPVLTGLSAGSYSGTVTVSAPGAAGSPATVPVSLTVSSATAAIHINCGGAAMTTADGTQWAADEYSNGGYVVYTGAAIAGVAAQDYYLYRSARSALYGDFSYAIPVANGAYAVMLHFAEIIDSAPGQRVFNVAINGSTVLSNFDILTHVAPDVPLLEQFNTNATNGVVQISVTGVVGHGILNAIDVVPIAAPPPPSLSVVTTPLTFAATAGGANPATQTVAVGNSGGGTLNWTASGNQTWLTVSPGSGTNTGTLTIGAVTGSLTAGSYSGTVTVTGGGSTQTVGVTFNVAAAPTLSVATTPLTFAATAGGASPATQTVAVSNPGGGTLNWTASGNQTWLTVSPGSGTNAGTLTVGAVTGSLTAGSYSGMVTVTGGGSTQTVSITFNVAAPPTLSVVTTTLTFGATVGGANPATQTAAVSNSGTGTLNWTASGNQTWLTVSPGSGTNAGTLTIGAVTGSLTVGSYSGAVTVTGGGSTQTVPITFNVTAAPTPVLTLAATALSFSAISGGANPATQTVNVSNTGGGTLNWNASSNQTWLTVSPVSGTNAGTLTLGAAIGSLAAGTYSGSVTVSAAGATGSPQTINVTFTIAPPPTLAVDTTAVWFAATTPGSNPAAQTVNVSNTGGGTVNWSASGNQPWLTVSPASGANAGVLSIGATLGSLAVGTYTGTVTVSAPGIAGSPQKIGVTFGITLPPVLNTSPASLSFTSTVGTSPAAQSINVTNTGGGSLDWAVTGDQNWLVVRPSSGSAPAAISVQPNATGLAVGTYSANVTVSAAGVSGSPQTIPVSVTITAAPPSMTVLSTSLSFMGAMGGANPSAQAVGIANSGAGTINWTASSNQTWLTLTPTSGSTPGSISIQPVLTGLAVGNYSATVTVNGGAVTGSPATFTVNLTVTSSSGAPIPLPTNGNNWFVSTDGSASADGSYGNPWDIATALLGPASVKPGDSIWLRGGKYGDGQYNSILYSRLIGTAAKPIVVRAYPGERVTIDESLQVGCCDGAIDPTQGSYVWFWGLEFASFNPNRTAGADGPPAWGFQYNHNSGDMWGPGTKFINNIVHDTASGLSVWSATNAELTGNIIYNIGGYGPDRGHGHSFYLQNQAPSVVTANDNIAFNNFDIGMQVYGNGTYGYVQNMQLTGNIVFNSGILYGHRADNLLVGGGINGPSGIVVKNNYFFNTPEANDGYNELGFLWTPEAIDAVVTNNYFIGGSQAIDVERWDSLTFQNNTIYANAVDETMFIYSDTQNPATYHYQNNHYYGSGLFMVVPNCDGWPCANAQTYPYPNWQSLTGLDAGSTFTPGPPTGLWAAVRPNAYEPGRANIVVFNWNLSPTVTVDLSASGIKIGDSYQIRDTENWYNGPVVSGIYTGSPVTIPMTGLTVMQPFGSVPYPVVHTAPQFGAFVLLSGQSLVFNY
jgi:Malectin domain/Viral BACON domain